MTPLFSAEPKDFADDGSEGLSRRERDPLPLRAISLSLAGEERRGGAVAKTAKS